MAKERTWDYWARVEDDYTYPQTTTMSTLREAYADSKLSDDWN